jgi:hypothetical protein
MLRVHEETIEAVLEALQNGEPAPPRDVWEGRLNAARQDADRATSEAERLLERLARSAAIGEEAPLEAR